MDEYSDTPCTPEIDYEKLSYGKLGYKRVQRLRRKGQRRGIEVPPLGFELHKPDKPRLAFWAAAIVSIVLMVALLVGVGFLIKYAIDFFNVQFADSGGFFKTLASPEVFLVTAGLSLIPLMLIIMAYAMLLLIFLIPLFLALYCFSLARKALYLARCSKEEFAIGGFVADRIFNFICTLAVATLVLIVVLAKSDVQAVKIVVGLIYAVVVIIFGGLLAIILLEKAKCKKWFEGLDEDKKENYIAHEKALRRIKSRLHLERSFWDGLGK